VRGRKYKEYLDQFSIYEFELACVILCTQVLCGNLYGKVLENHRCRARNDRMTANKEQKRMRIGGRSPITGTISAFWRNWGKPRNNASISHIPAAIRQWQRPNVRNGANLIAFFFNSELISRKVKFDVIFTYELTYSTRTAVPTYALRHEDEGLTYAEPLCTDIKFVTERLERSPY